MERYRHTQPGRLLRVLFGALIVIVALLLRTQGPDDPTPMYIALGAFGFFVLLLAFFHALTVVVTDEVVRLVYGVGAIRKTWSVREIADAKAVRNRWYYGWGIRYYGWLDREGPSGWLFNVSGFDAVEFRLRDGRSYRIGTDDPAGLLAALRRAAGLTAG